MGREVLVGRHNGERDAGGEIHTGVREMLVGMHNWERGTGGETY